MFGKSVVGSLKPSKVIASHGHLGQRKASARKRANQTRRREEDRIDAECLGISVIDLRIKRDKEVAARAAYRKLQEKELVREATERAHRWVRR